MKVATKHSRPSFDSKLDLTPLIDCIFQLILFLVLTSQITIQAEDVALPFALEGEEEDPGAKVADAVPPLIINVVARKRDPGEEGERLGDIVFMGKRFDNDEKKLGAELKKEVEWDASPRGRGRGYEPGPGGRPLSKLSVLVRADKGVRAEYVRTIFLACQAAAIYRLRVSTTLPQPR